ARDLQWGFQTEEQAPAPKPHSSFRSSQREARKGSQRTRRAEPSGPDPPVRGRPPGRPPAAGTKTSIRRKTPARPAGCEASDPPHYATRTSQHPRRRSHQFLEFGRLAKLCELRLLHQLLPFLESLFQSHPDVLHGALGVARIGVRLG